MTIWDNQFNEVIFFLDKNLQFLAYWIWYNYTTKIDGLNKNILTNYSNTHTFRSALFADLCTINIPNFNF